jgi:eukaryotic-like serine/threonine-protein kinase
MDTFNIVGVESGLPMTGPLVLPHDLKVVPLATIPAEIRIRLQGEDGDFVVTRPLSRTPSKVIDSSAAGFLREFEKPTTLVDAIMRLSKSMNRKPAELLEELYPFLERCLTSKLLVEPGLDSETIRFSMHPGDVFAGCTIEECIQVLEDTEVYRVSARNCDGALKLVRTGADPKRNEHFKKEASILRRLPGKVAPRLIFSGEDEIGRAYLVMEWISFPSSGEAAAALRTSSPEPTPSLAMLCANVIDAYAALHDAGIIHADVHPNNILVADDGTVRIIDYGFSRIDSSPVQEPLLDDSHDRAGVGFYFEPECAAALLAGSTPPAATRSGEQYAVSALVYFLLTGCSYLDFSLGKNEVLEEIVALPPVPLLARGRAGLQPLEEVLFRALSKDPAARFSDVATMATAFRESLQDLLLQSQIEASTPEIAAPIGSRSCSDRSKQSRNDWLGSTLHNFVNPNIELPADPSIVSLSSFTEGAAGIAAGLFRIACVRQDAELFARAERWLNRSLHDLNAAASAQSGARTAWIQALISNSNGNLGDFSKATERFLALSREACHHSHNAIQLSAFLLASSHLLDLLNCEPSIDPAPLINLGNTTSEQLWMQLSARPSRDEAEFTDDLGIGGGIAGYLYSILRWLQAAGSREPDRFRNRLDELAATIQSKHTYLRSGGWSRGPAGFVFLWTTAHRVLKDSRWLLLAQGAATDVLESEYEGSSLCSGLAGKAYSLLNIYKHTGLRHWLDHAFVAAETALHESLHKSRSQSDFIPTLYQSNLGLAILIADLEHPRTAVMPFFEAEPWPR